MCNILLASISVYSIIYIKYIVYNSQEVNELPNICLYAIIILKLYNCVLLSAIADKDLESAF